MADVDAVNERLNGLMTLLQAVGVGTGLESADMAGFKGGDMPDARQLNDEQVEALIRKLQQAQAEAPQIIAALEARAEGRSLKDGKANRESPRQQPQQQQQPQEEDEDDSEYDDDANYPMVGYGCSDEVSVVSDMTTPTVVSCLHVPDEEHYRDTLPPMIIGGGSAEAPPMLINPTKKKNLVSQVRPSSGIAPPPRRNAPAPNRTGGAAASRRKNYQETMSRLHDNPHSAGYSGPSGSAQQPSSSRRSRSPPPPQHQQQPRRVSQVSSPPAPPAASSAPAKKRVPRPAPAHPSKSLDHASSSNFSDLANNSRSKINTSSWDNSGWNTFESRPPSQRRHETTVDNDGFLVGESFDPFGGGGGRVSSNAGDLAFSPSGFDPFGAVPSRKTSKSSRDSSGSNNNDKPRIKRPESGGSSSRLAPPPQQTQSRKVAPPPPPPQQASSASGTRLRRTRRASLAT